MTEEQFLSVFKTSRDFIHDFNNFLECNKKLQNYKSIKVFITKSYSLSVNNYKAV